MIIFADFDSIRAINGKGSSVRQACSYPSRRCGRFNRALVQQDKELAHERIQDAFRLFSDTIERFQGHLLEIRGDALLAEFERAINAVTAALSFQVDHIYQLSRLEDDLRPTIRVGIAMGEVVVADSTVTGAGVVQAQRIEQLSDPGGLCITAAIHEALSKRMPFNFESLGDQVLKGFDHTVHVYRVELKPGESIPLPQIVNQRQSLFALPQLKWAIVVLVLVVIAGLAYFYKPPSTQNEALRSGPATTRLDAACASKPHSELD